MTNLELANALEITERAVVRYQSVAGKRSVPSYERLTEIARVLGKPLSYFLDDEAAAA
jgi:transcriptional regulator with XRE-family HTH domain